MRFAWARTSNAGRLRGITSRPVAISAGARDGGAHLGTNIEHEQPCARNETSSITSCPVANIAGARNACAHKGTRNIERERPRGHQRDVFEHHELSGREHRGRSQRVCSPGHNNVERRTTARHHELSARDHRGRSQRVCSPGHERRARTTAPTARRLRASRAVRRTARCAAEQRWAERESSAETDRHLVPRPATSGTTVSIADDLGRERTACANVNPQLWARTSRGPHRRRADRRGEARVRCRPPARNGRDCRGASVRSATVGRRTLNLA
jgi:hypothetical protein